MVISKSLIDFFVRALDPKLLIETNIIHVNPSKMNQKKNQIKSKCRKCDYLKLEIYQSLLETNF